jgi:hypothetical protein
VKQRELEIQNSWWKYQITNLQNTISGNNYKIYFIDATDNKIIEKWKISQQFEFSWTFLLELETKNNNFDEVYYYSPNSKKIKWNKSGDNYIFEIKDFFDLPNYKVKDSINVWNIEYNLLSINFEYSSYYCKVFPNRNGYSTISFDTFKDFDELNDISLERILQKGQLWFPEENKYKEISPHLPEYIYVSIKESPIIFRYEIDNWNLKQNFFVVQLTPDEEKLLQSNGNVMDLKLTKKLIWDFLHQWINWITGFWLDENEKYLMSQEVWDAIEITQQSLPIINLRKINNEWYYYVSFITPYEFIPYQI